MRVLVTGGSGFIGTNLVSCLMARGAEVLSADPTPPQNPDHKAVWQRLDIVDRDATRRLLNSFAPTHVVHLGARTDLRETRDIAGYRANTDGVSSIIEAAKCRSTLERIVFASSMLVCRNGYTPTSDTDYCPSTLYGESKVLGEHLVRSDADSLPWVIIRPTSIWGPWFGIPYNGFFRTVLKRRYVHPGHFTRTKALGFVGNAVHQIHALLAAQLESVHRRTFYLCDTPAYSVRQWVESIQRNANIGWIPTIPTPVLRVAALAGDVLQKAGYANPPLTTFRINNMMTGSYFNIDGLSKITGPLPYTLDEGVKATLDWLRQTST